MVIWRGDVKPRFGAPGMIGDEVRERLVKRPNGVIYILIILLVEDKERIDR
jgi:hypothetical protein